MDGQSGLEIVVGSLDGRIYAWNASGTALTGWPKRVRTALYGGPALIDVHNAGRHSVIVGGYDGRLFVYELGHRLFPREGSFPVRELLLPIPPLPVSSVVQEALVLPVRDLVPIEQICFQADPAQI